MRLTEVKIGKCEECGGDMVVRTKVTRFCSLACKNEWWSKNLKLRRKIAKKKSDLFGFNIAAE